MEYLTFDQISHLSLRDQYVLFVKTVVQQQQIWGLYDEDKEGWAMTNDGQRERLPLWLSVHMAEACRSGDWLNCSPLPLEVDAFIREMTDELMDAGRGLSILYQEAEGGLDIEPDQLRKDLMLVMG